MRSLGHSDALDFPFQHDVGFFAHPAADFLAERLDVATGRAARVQKEIAVLFRNLRPTEHHSTAARGVDQRPGPVAGRIFESRAARTAAQRLRFLSGAGDGVHLRTDSLGLAGCAAKYS